LGRNSDANHKTISVEQGEEIVQVEVQKLNLVLVEAVGVARQVTRTEPKSLARSVALSGWSDP